VASAANAGEGLLLNIQRGRSARFVLIE
jgi:hypothetical protein